MKIIKNLIYILLKLLLIWYNCSEVFMNNNRFKKKPKQDIEDNYIPPFDAGELGLLVESLNINEVTLNLLKGANNNTVLDLVKKTEKDFYKILTFNKKNLFEVINKLKAKGFHLKPMPVVPKEEGATATDAVAASSVPLQPKPGQINVESPQKDNRRQNDRATQPMKPGNPPRGIPQKEETPQKSREERPLPRQAGRNDQRQPRMPIINGEIRADFRQDGNDRFSQNPNNQRQSRPMANNDTRVDFRQDGRNLQNNDRSRLIEQLKLNPITLKLLKSAGFRFIEEIVSNSESELMKVKGLKKKDLFQILEKLDALGLSLREQEVEVKKKRAVREIIKDEPDIYVKINKNGKWGFQDRNGKQTVAPIYDEVFSFKEDACCVEVNERFGFIDRNGDEIVPIIYECACSFSEGCACVFKNNKCGYIDKANNIIIDFLFDAGTAMLDGNCRVKRDGKWGELTLATPSEIRWII